MLIVVRVKMSILCWVVGLNLISRVCFKAVWASKSVLVPLIYRNQQNLSMFCMEFISTLHVCIKHKNALVNLSTFYFWEWKCLVWHCNTTYKGENSERKTWNRPWSVSVSTNLEKSENSFIVTQEVFVIFALTVLLPRVSHNSPAKVK